jgi:RNA polymerase sigma-70 factor (ECF subfamily)
MNGPQARALTNSVTNTIETSAEPLGFDEAFVLHHRTVYKVARSLVRDPGLAEDVTQEVFLKLYNNLESAPRDQGLRPWLLRITVNVARNTLRGRSRSIAREEEFAKKAVTEGWLTAAVDDEYERRAEISETRRALDKIKEPMRSCLLLKQQGLSYREIATTLSLNEVNVGSLIARGRKEFLRVYGKVGGRKE